MQALYALRQAEASDFQLAIDFITDTFRPDLNSMEVQEPKKLDKMRKLALMALDEIAKGADVSKDQELPTQAYRTAKDAFEYYQKKVVEDRVAYARMMLKESEVAYETYLWVLTMLAEFGKIAKADRERAYDDPDFAIAKESGLDSNVIINVLVESKTLENEAARHGINWEEEIGDLRRIYREVFKTDQTYRDYCQAHQHTPDEDQKLAQYALRQLILKSEGCVTYFEAKDLNWAENQQVVRDMSIKTLKTAAEPGAFKLSVLSENWEDDRWFMEELFRKTIENDIVFEGLINDQLKNWDADRVAMTDNILMKMALAEMMNFSAIPVKVTINEIIEIAKDYSTPKSGIFVNGILDVLSKQLVENNTIRKSGRGLIDNK